MHRAGRIAIGTGAVSVSVGLAGGFGAMLEGFDGLALKLLTLVPLGFVLLFAGVVMTQLHRPGG